MKKIQFELIFCCPDCGNTKFVREDSFYICVNCKKGYSYGDLDSIDRII